MDKDKNMETEKVENTEVKKTGKGKRLFLSIFGWIIGIITIFMLRDDIQPALLFVRKYIFIEIIAAIFIFIAIRIFKKQDKPFKRALVIVGSLLFFASWYPAYPMYKFLKQYHIFSHIPLQEINKLPTTQNERIQPLNNIRTLAYEAVTETQEVSTPHLVKVDGDNRWTMAVQPAEEYVWQRNFDNTEELFAVSSTAPFPSFSSDNRQSVTFSVGESLMFSRNTYNACVKGFNLLQLFTLEPDAVYYMKNDSAEWVQVVSLIKWEGFLFPYPKFGGVMVFESGEHDFKDAWERRLVGKGKYISPKAMNKFEFLRGQNINSERVSRAYAETFMFLGGFLDPMPNRRKTAVKIPDLPADQNQLPFVTDFDFSEIDAPSGLYHYFGLEPIGEKRTGLSISVFIPADGTDRVFYYNHGIKKEGLAGVSAMPTKVQESRKEYDWTANKPVEFRPYIHEVGGERRMFWLTTVVTLREGTTQYDGSATPDIALIDAKYKDVIWVDATKPSTWEEQITEQLTEAWNMNEKN